MHSKFFLAIDHPHGAKSAAVGAFYPGRAERLIRRETRLPAWLNFSHLAVGSRQFEVLVRRPQSDRGHTR
jgi:hypothetical protein